MTDEPKRSGLPENGSGEDSPDPLAKLRAGGHGGAMKGAGQYAGLGLQFAVAIMVGLYLGNWLDGRLGTGPLFLVLGVFLGAGAAFYSIYKKVMGDTRDSASRKAPLDRDEKPK